MYKLLIVLLCLLGCGSLNENSDNNDNTPSGGEAPAAFKQYISSVSIYTQGDFVVLESNGTPNHNSPYFTTQDSRYEQYNGSNQNFHQNPNTIKEQSLVFKIPLNPSKASTHSKTRLGPIGISINGVALYNQFAGPNDQPLTNEINSFDQYNGHPQQSGQYHYHVEPLYITEQNGRDALIGFLLDGFPVYGPEENGKPVTNSDLDEYHGHTSVTKEYPNGIYHYHITDDDPYINGGYYYGTVGSVTQ